MDPEGGNNLAIRPVPRLLVWLERKGEGECPERKGRQGEGPTNPTNKWNQLHPHGPQVAHMSKGGGSLVKKVLAPKVGEEKRRESPGSFTVMDMLDNQETIGKLCFLCGLEVCGPCVQLRALFVNVGMIFLSILRVMKCISIHERRKSGRVHGDPAKREEHRGATSVGIAGVIHSKEASHSGKETLRSKALHENSR